VNFGAWRYIGLSEVQFFQRRERAGRPEPVDGGAIKLGPGAKLSWMAGLDVVSHKVYLGTEPNNLTLLGEVQEERYSRLPELEKRQWYYWRVDSERTNGSVVKGKVWRFSTGKLVAWYKFDEVNEDITPDSSGSGLRGKLIGDAKIISDTKRGNVLSLDGDGDYVYCGNNPAFNLRDEITVAVWVNITTVPDKWTGVVTKGNSSWRLSTDKNPGKFHFAVASGGVFSNPREAYGKTEVVANEWRHVVGTYDRTNTRLYVDGVEDIGNPGAYSGKIVINNHPVMIGTNAQFQAVVWNGLIDDVRIYNFALSEAEIKALNAGKGLGPTSD
jgi:hypothetical protein